MIVTVEYDMIMAVKIYSCVMGNYVTVSFYFLRISAIFCFVAAVLISLFNAEPSIIWRVLRENLQNNCYLNLDEKPENVSKELLSKFEGYRPAFFPNSSTKYELLQRFCLNYKFSLLHFSNLCTSIFMEYVVANFIDWIKLYKRTD